MVDSALIAFAGFPANMGEAGVKMTLEAFGSLKSFKWEPDDDGISSSGQASLTRLARRRRRSTSTTAWIWDWARR